jgi:hypothetical protein
MTKEELQQIKKIQEYADRAIEMDVDHLDGDDVIVVMKNELLKFIKKAESKQATTSNDAVNSQEIDLEQDPY